MAVLNDVLCLKCILLYGALTWTTILALTLSNAQTTRQTKYGQISTPGSGALVTPSASAPVTDSNKGVAVYRVRDVNDETCILLKTDGVIEIDFKVRNRNDPEDNISEYLPDNPTVVGNCDSEDKSSMEITWKAHSLKWTFGKTPGRERWYVNNVELTIDSDFPKYKNLGIQSKKFTLAHRQMLIPTPSGKSYSCEETVLELNPDYKMARGLHGKLFLRSFQLQPFMYKGDNFDPPFDCNGQMAFRDETAPIAVGSTLAIAVLATVTGYGVFRYFKIKKVQYNTMG